ncbi:DUF262 domain-containing protein [Psychrobacter glacincola]|uniref:DUF262 domain-containing protein n=1 Tax=Psychrobacter glacincola TaxID=56810 RepID=A0ABW1W6V0_9GAMM|nr:DUF262 domain-containing protein [Psychrobacter glacincola]
MSDQKVNNEGYQILSIASFLSLATYPSDKRLAIPVYQRPYRWTEKNIADLLTDLYYQCSRLNHNVDNSYKADNAYRLGTVVLHQDNEKVDSDGQTPIALVDGQQRTLTLLLIIKAAAESEKFKQTLEGFTSIDIQLPDCNETQENLSINYELIKRHVNSPAFTLEVLDFLMNHCEIVQVTLHELSEAFQFFDSQNARGLDLSPHDLLKAFHLREFPETEKDLKESIVEYWEQKNTKDLKVTFSDYLYPIRQWSLGKSSLYFSKSDIQVFKGVNLTNANYPFQQGLKVLNNTVDSYNQHTHRLIDQQTMTYPFQLTQTLINGRRFFDWVTYYQALIMPFLEDATRQDDNWLKAILSHKDRQIALTIIQVLDNQKQGEDYKYSHWWRQGDRYVRRMFNALVLCYYDRYGEQDLARAIEYIFIWAYSLRLQNASVYRQSIEKYIDSDNVFMRLQHSLTPVEFLNKPLQQLQQVNTTGKDRDKKLKQVAGLTTIFTEMGYLSEQAVLEIKRDKR